MPQCHGAWPRGASEPQGPGPADSEAASEAASTRRRPGRRDASAAAASESAESQAGSGWPGRGSPGSDRDWPGKSLRLLLQQASLPVSLSAGPGRVCQAESAADRDGASRGPGPDSPSRSWCTASRCNPSPRQAHSGYVRVRVRLRMARVRPLTPSPCQPLNAGPVPVCPDQP